MFQPNAGAKECLRTQRSGSQFFTHSLRTWMKSRSGKRRVSCTGLAPSFLDDIYRSIKLNGGGEFVSYWLRVDKKQVDT